MGILDWLFGYESGIITPNGSFIKCKNPQAAAEFMRQMQNVGMTASFNTNGDVYLFDNRDPKPWDGKLWYPLGENYGR